LVVDASQSLGAYPFDVAEVRPDFLVTVGYKWLLGPYGLGYLYVAERWHAKGEPLEEPWLNRAGSENFAGLVDYTDEYQPGAQRFNMGESAQFYLLPMALAALTQIAQWTPARIQQQLTEWTSELTARTATLGLDSMAREQRVGHMVGPHCAGRAAAGFVRRARLTSGICRRPRSTTFASLRICTALRQISSDWSRPCRSCSHE
jgi:selenocysteine lyase/cysteine desulfurase